MGEKKNDPPNRATDLDRARPADDPVAVPNPTDSGHDSGWRSGQPSADPHGSGFEPTPPRSLLQGVAYASTQPAGLAAAPAPAPASERIERVTADQVMAIVRRNNRVCPLPPQWQGLYELIGARAHGQAPPPPLTGPAWHRTSSLAKRMCLREHLEFAEAVGRLAEAREFLQFLPEEQWYHMGE